MVDRRQEHRRALDAEQHYATQLVLAAAGKLADSFAGEGADAQATLVDLGGLVAAVVNWREVMGRARPAV